MCSKNESNNVKAIIEEIKDKKGDGKLEREYSIFVFNDEEFKRKLENEGFDFEFLVVDSKIFKKHILENKSEKDVHRLIERLPGRIVLLLDGQEEEFWNGIGTGEEDNKFKEWLKKRIVILNYKEGVELKFKESGKGNELDKLDDLVKIKLYIYENWIFRHWLNSDKVSLVFEPQGDDSSGERMNACVKSILKNYLKNVIKDKKTQLDDRVIDRIAEFVIMYPWIKRNLPKNYNGLLDMLESKIGVYEIIDSVQSETGNKYKRVLERDFFGKVATLLGKLLGNEDTIAEDIIKEIGKFSVLKRDIRNQVKYEYSQLDDSVAERVAEFLIMYPWVKREGFLYGLKSKLEVNDIIKCVQSANEHNILEKDFEPVLNILDELLRGTIAEDMVKVKERFYANYDDYYSPLALNVNPNGEKGKVSINYNNKDKKKSVIKIKYHRHSSLNKPCKEYYHESLSGSTGHFNIILSSVLRRATPYAKQKMIYRLLENGLLRIAIADERIARFIVADTDRAIALECAGIYVLNNLDGLELVISDSSEKREISMGNFVDGNLFKIEEKKNDNVDVLIIHQTLLDKVSDAISEIDWDATLIEWKQKYFPLIVVTSGRGRPRNVPKVAKFIPFSELESYIMTVPHQKFNLSERLFELFNVSIKEV